MALFSKALVCREFLSDTSEEQRLLAFRVLRAAGQDVIALTGEMIDDPHAAVRRELAVSQRDLDDEKKLPLVIELFASADGEDRHYLEACGLAAEDIETEVWTALNEAQGEAPLDWSAAHARQTWRLLPEPAVADLIVRATADTLSLEDRKLAMETLAFIGNREAVATIADLASGESDLSVDAAWWMINRGLTEWAAFGTRELLKERGIYDSETIVLQSSTVPEPVGETQLPSPQELVKMTGVPVAGKAQAMRCVMCHQIDGVGVEFGPDLHSWVANQGLEAFYEAVIHPSAGIAHGYTGTAITLNDGSVIEGLVFSKLDPVVVVSTGGLEQLVPQDRIKRMKKMGNKSLMFSADQLGFTAQQLADLAAYLETF